MGVNRCSVCLREPYCSGNCQKGDWKSHKLLCKNLKKLSLQIQPYQTVINVIDEIKKEMAIPQKNELKIRILEHLISYTEHQFGDRVPGSEYRERKNGDQIDLISNWEVEMFYLAEFYSSLICVYQNDDSSIVVCDKLSYTSLEKIFDLLKPWTAYLDSNSTAAQTDSIDKDQINRILKLSSETERNMARVYTNKNLFKEADPYCRRAISQARLFEGEDKVKADLLYSSLRCSYENLAPQGRFTEGLIYVEEAYNCIAMEYDPKHSKVQEAATTLIECLIHKGDLFDAG
jgi:hypothetical protein